MILQGTVPPQGYFSAASAWKHPQCNQVSFYLQHPTLKKGVEEPSKELPALRSKHPAAARPDAAFSKKTNYASIGPINPRPHGDQRIKVFHCGTSRWHHPQGGKKKPLKILRTMQNHKQRCDVTTQRQLTVNVR